MAVSNPATFASIKAEFGGSNNFKDYYRGGPYVPASAATAISTTASGLRMSQFNGVTAYTAVQASVSPTSASGSSSGPNASGSVQTNQVTASGSAGNGSYTYAWTIVAGSAITISNPSGATTVFTHFTGNAQTYTGTARVTVSDGTTSATVDVPLSFSYTRGL